ncbi:FAD dependent oxidoreductase [Mycena alexandri]|uniref:FAD dependent oxidoreductase n=1 Tax=Mycena alexandri TaxID=1745969 RepID=A0AAD6WU06_9AGAR|nr:FAD dependent oxidoreductase [Mycena alexandri]
MASLSKLCTALAVASVFSSTLALEVCTQIQKAMTSASTVSFPGARVGNYTADVFHWVASSSQSAACSVEPGTAADVSTIIQLLGKAKAPFAVKGGGHSGNPGFSSTTGVQISMRRFSSVTYNNKSGTADIGPGLTWDQVYTALEPHGVVVAGGRVGGIGMAGFTLGGGYNWLTNQVGLTIDTVTAYELVKPNGKIVTVTAASDPDLFFALKGGGNNFGIITKFTLKTFARGNVWGGAIGYPPSALAALQAAVLQFNNNVTDPKAQIIPGYTHVSGEFEPSIVLFYDGPSQPAKIYDAFLAIPNLFQDVSPRSMGALVASVPTDQPAGTRGYFHGVTLTGYSSKLLAAIANETSFWGARLPGVSVGYHIEPFLETIYAHNTMPTAFPWFRTPRTMPLNLQYTWNSSTPDAIVYKAMKQSAEYLTKIAVQDGTGVANAPIYPNYALFGTPLGSIYGNNIPRLRTIKAQVDPHNVMGLAGGWKL